MFTFTFEAGAASIDAVSSPVVQPAPAGPRPGSARQKGADRGRRADQSRPAARAIVADRLPHAHGGQRRGSHRVHDDWHPDLVLMDLRMPGIGGLEAMRRLRASGRRPCSWRSRPAASRTRKRGARRRCGCVRAEALPGGRLARRDRRQLGVRYATNRRAAFAAAHAAPGNDVVAAIEKPAAGADRAVARSGASRAAPGGSNRSPIRSAQHSEAASARFGRWPGTSSTTRSCRHCDRDTPRRRLEVPR